MRGSGALLDRFGRVGHSGGIGVWIMMSVRIGYNTERERRMRKGEERG